MYNLMDVFCDGLKFDSIAKWSLLVLPNPTFSLLGGFGGKHILGPIFGFKRVGLGFRILKWVQLGPVDLKQGSNLDSVLCFTE